MANPKLTVEIDADVSKMEKELSKANKLLAQHERNYAGVQKAISSNTQTARNLEMQISRLSNEFKSGAISEKQYARETDRLSQELREVNSSTSNYQRELRRLENEMQRAKNATDNYARSTSQTQTATKNTGQEIGKMAKTTKVNAVPAMTSFSQVVQDAPYGIQGVANNIQQLTMQMGYLSNQAGGTSAAFKSLVGSLAGPAGILLAVSVVTSLLVKYGDKLGELVGTTNRLAKATKEYVGEAMTEASQLKSLLGIVNNQEASIVSRRKALDMLNEKYSDYLGNLTLEGARTDKTRGKVDELTKSLIKQAQVRGLQDTISEINSEFAESLTNLQIKQRDAFKRVRNELKSLDQTGYWGSVIRDSDDVIGSLREMIATGEQLPSALNQAVSQWRGINKEIRNTQSEAEAATMPFQELQQSLENDIFQFKAVPEFSQDEVIINGKKGGSADPIRIPIEPMLNTEGMGGTLGFELQQNIMSQIKALEQLQKVLPETSKEYEFLGNQIQFLEDRLTGFNTTLTESANKSLEEFGRMASGIAAINEEQQARLEEQAQQHAQHQQMIAGIVSSSFNAMGSELIDAASEGEVAFKDLTSIILKSVGKMLTALLSQAIGNAVLAGTQSSLAAGPGAAFVMPGLIGLTTGAVQNSFPQFEDGGIVGGNSLYGDKILARVNSKEAIFNQDQQRSIWGQMNRPPAVGMGEPIEIVGETIIQGDDLRVIYQRNERNRARQT